MTRAWSVVVGVACAWCSVARADVVKLADLEARALSQRPEVAASAARVRAAGAEIGAAESAYYPQVSATVDGTIAPGRALLKIHQDGRDYLVSGSTTIGEGSAFSPHPRYGANLAARGNIYDFGRTHSALEAARAKERASEADASARAQVMVLELRAAYLRWSVAQALWELTKRAEADAKTRADRVGGLIAEGAAPPSAATAASAQANAAATESQRAEMELEVARLELGYLSARDLGPDSLPDPSLLEVRSQPSAANVTSGSAAVGPVAVKLEPAVGARLGPLGPSEPRRAAKYLQPAAGGVPAGPGSPPPSTAPVIPPHSTAPATPPPSAAGGASPLSAPAAAPPPSAAGTSAPAGARDSSLAPAQAASGVTGPRAPPGALPPPSAASTATDPNPQLAALETARAAAEAARRMQSRMSAPALGYRVSAGVDGQDARVFPVYGFGIGLTIPLWDGGATSAAEAVARATEAELAADLDAERARDKHVRARRDLQLEHADKLLALAENAVSLAETRVQQLLQGPTLSTSDQEVLASAEADRTKAQADLVRAKAARVQLQLGL